MTDNPIGKKLYWFYACYLSFLPVLLCIGLFAIAKALFAINLDFLRVALFPMWIVSFIGCGLILNKPYDKMYDKWRWEYDDHELRNIRNNIIVTNDDIMDVYIGYIYNKKNREPCELTPNYWQSKTLILVTKANKILALQLETLTNGSEMQDKIIQNNKTKIKKGSYVTNMRIKPFVLQSES